MANKNVRVRYRPIRIGWCIRNHNLDDFRRALRLTHALWGGKYNPVIPVGAASADDLVGGFRVDLLFGLDQSSETESFVASFPYLQSPLFNTNLFENYPGRVEPNYLDVSHSLNRIAHEIGKRGDSSDGELSSVPEANPYGLVDWTSDDPLGDLFLATFGAYAAPQEIGRNYERFIRENIKPACYVADPAEPIPAYLLDQTMPSDISALDLRWDRVPSNASMGFYAGKADDFDDLVNYWNLRAADLNVLFLDPNHSRRLERLRDDHLEFIQQRQGSTEYRKKRIHVWSRSQEVVQQLAFDPVLVPHYFAIDGTVSIRGDLHPPLHYFKQKTVLASFSERYGEADLAFQLPDKPFESDEEFSPQHFIVSVRPQSEEPDDDKTLWTPYLPELNHWYGLQQLSISRAMRVEIDGVGIISQISDESLKLSPMKKQAVASRLFEFVGIDAQHSVPGIIASRLIAQLGGLQGCRVLKIAGVRKLIKGYGPLEEFSRTLATEIIGNRHPVTGKPDFSDYEGLFIEQRDPKRAKLTPEDAFLYLLDKRVFRVGLTLTCSVCALQFWASVDDVSAEMACDLCGNRFSITRQLKDRSWMYRRSGLFGSNNNQEGSIPVALTLQQLAANLDSSYSPSLFLTNMSLKPITAIIDPCETDIVVATQGHDGIQVAVGECKDAGGVITAEDARKMGAVADAFPADKFDPYVIFSKTAPFTPEDIANCRLAQPKNQRFRVIMLSDRELEPHRVYERSFDGSAAKSVARSLSSMASVTHDVFFAPE
jgi:hypothetical protein